MSSGSSLPSLGFKSSKNFFQNLLLYCCMPQTLHPGTTGQQLASRGCRLNASSRRRTIHLVLIPTKIHCIHFVSMNLANMSSLQMWLLLDTVSRSGLPTIIALVRNITEQIWLVATISYAQNNQIQFNCGVWSKRYWSAYQHTGCEGLISHKSISYNNTGCVA